MQGELFEASQSIAQAAKIQKSRTPNWLDLFQVTLRIDHLMIGSISALVLYVLVFSFGVERGKRYATDEIRVEKLRQEQIAQELPAPLLSVSMPKDTTSSKGSSLPVPSQASAPTAKETPTPATKIDSALPLSGEYTIQIVTYKSKRQAEERVDYLRKTGVRGFIVPQGKFFQVCADAFIDMKEARQKLTKLKAEGDIPPDAYIRPLKGLLA